MIPTTIGVLVARHKRKQAGAAESEVDPGTGIEAVYPVTEFLLDAVNNGVVDDIETHVHPDFELFLNGHSVGVHHDDGDGPGVLVDTLAVWRRLMPDLHWSLEDEVISKHDGAVAIRFVVSGTHTGTDPTLDMEPTGAPLRYEVSAFLHLDKGKLRKMYQTADLHDVMAQLGIGT